MHERCWQAARCWHQPYSGDRPEREPPCPDPGLSGLPHYCPTVGLASLNVNAARKLRTVRASVASYG
jgi:hypothetical protein